MGKKKKWNKKIWESYHQLKSAAANVFDISPRGRDPNISDNTIFSHMLLFLSNPVTSFQNNIAGPRCPFKPAVWNFCPRPSCPSLRGHVVDAKSLLLGLYKMPLTPNNGPHDLTTNVPQKSWFLTLECLKMLIQLKVKMHQMNELWYWDMKYLTTWRAVCLRLCGHGCPTFMGPVITNVTQSLTPFLFLKNREMPDSRLLYAVAVQSPESNWLYLTC